MQDKKLKLDDVSGGIDKGLSTSDEQRVSALERLQIVRKAKAASLDKEQARLAIKYGEDHPRVQAVAARATLNRGFVNDLIIETIRAKVEIPIVDQVSWVLHGFVRDLNRTGLSNLTIALFDGREHQSNWVKRLGYACSDGKGYFKLSVADLSITQKPVFVRVLNSQGLTFYCGLEPFTPEGGQVDYREIIMSGEAQECTPPPPRSSGDTWTVRGNIKDNANSAFPGLTVSIADRDGKLADRFGTTKSNAKGEFEFIYPAAEFADIDHKPVDLFLKVLDSNTEPIYVHDPPLHFESGTVETIAIVINEKPSGVKTKGGALFAGSAAEQKAGSSKATKKRPAKKSSKK